MDSAGELYQELILPIEDRMKSIVIRLLRDPEEVADVLQNVLEEVWKRLKRIHQHPNPHAYILRLCHSAAYDSLRRRARHKRWEMSMPENMDTASSQQADDILQYQAIVREITRLPKKQALAVMMRALDEESFDDIGKALKCSSATARSHFSKGRAKLRELLRFEQNNTGKECKA